ncbi:MAG: GxxExxY protein [Ignavibacteriota bacterium]
MELLHSDITDRIIKAYYAVYNKLGYGFLEKVYEKAICIELRKMGFRVESQKAIKVFYDEETIGEYYADVVVDELVIIELKAAEGLAEEHERQLLNYLKATQMEVGLLLNFGVKAQFKRKIFMNANKNPRLSAQSA